MTEYRRVLAALYLVSFACLSGVCAAQPKDSALRGTWIGRITADDWYGIPSEQVDALRQAPESSQFRLRKTRAGQLRAYYPGRYGGWIAFRKQLVHFNANGRAVLSAQIETPDAVETLAFTIAEIDQDTLIVYLWYLFNEAPESSEADHAIWAIGGSGEFRRIGR